MSGWTPQRSESVAAGDSICISGVCLTVAEPPAGGGVLMFDVVGETLARTTLGALAVGDRVNVEPAVTPTQPLGGHVVQGHVDETGRVERVTRGGATGDDWRVEIAASPGLIDLLPSKASVAVEGVSLTVAASRGASFEVALVPTTLERTTLGELRAGDAVNLEADVLAKHVAHLLRRWRAGRGGRVEGEGVTRELLRDAGFTA